MFEHKLYNGFKLERVETSKGRYYKTPQGGLYPSVTTVIQDVFPKDLSSWVDRVGEREANKITTQAANRGTNLHKICEDYLFDRLKPFKYMPAHLSLFKQLQPHIDRTVEIVYGSELPLYSDQLEIAGTTDLLCRAHGINTIVDFKSSRRTKKEEWVEGYFIQATCYAMMAEERYNITVPQLIIMMAVDDDQPQYFLKHTNQYREKVMQMAKLHAKYRAVDLFSDGIV